GVRARAAVHAAAGTILDLSGDGNDATIIDKHGKAIQNNNPTFGLGVNPQDERFNPFALGEGHWASGSREVVLDANTAADEGFAVGDNVRIAAEGPAVSYRVTGIAKF